VTVTEKDGNVVAQGQGEGTEVDWTWDARTIPAGKYLYAIDAGPTVRPATGVVTGSTTRSMLTALAKPGLITPNGDGHDDSTLVRYRIREPAVVTATLVDAFGTPITTLFVQSKTTGSYAFRWDATGIADGRYGIVLTARNAIGIETTATLAVIVDRTLAGFQVSPQIFSPNRDGRLDPGDAHDPSWQADARPGLLGTYAGGAAGDRLERALPARGRRARVSGRPARHLSGGDRQEHRGVRDRHDRPAAEAPGSLAASLLGQRAR
jgi:hypothetical protein